MHIFPHFPLFFFKLKKVKHPDLSDSTTFLLGMQNHEQSVNIPASYRLKPTDCVCAAVCFLVKGACMVTKHGFLLQRCDEGAETIQLQKQKAGKQISPRWGLIKSINTIQGWTKCEPHVFAEVVGWKTCSADGQNHLGLFLNKVNLPNVDSGQNKI